MYVYELVTALVIGSDLEEIGCHYKSEFKLEANSSTEMPSLRERLAGDLMECLWRSRGPPHFRGVRGHVPRENF